MCATVHDYCCREGEEGDNFYVIESGDFVAVKGGQQVFKYEGSGSFGELALMYNCPRAATVQVGVFQASCGNIGATMFRLWILYHVSTVDRLHVTHTIAGSPPLSM